MSDPIAVRSTEMARIDELVPHGRNYRTHPPDQLEHIKQSIKESGFYRNVVVAEDSVILAGHGVVEAAKELGMAEVPIVRLPIASDSAKALKVLTGDNYVSHLAHNDDRILTEMLKDLDGEGELLGTGFDIQMVAALVMVTRPASEIASIDAAEEWAGMPEYNVGEEQITAKVYFLSSEDREKFLGVLGATEGCVEKRGKGFSLWWPTRKRNDLMSVQIVAEEE